MLDADGVIAYANQAMETLGAWAPGSTLGTHFTDYIHPDDVEWVTRAFSDVAQPTFAPQQLDLPRTPAWPSIGFRLLADLGRIVPVEVTGTNELIERGVGGVIYDVRPIQRDAIVDRVIAGVARAEPTDGLLRLVLETIGLPPLDLDVALVERHSGHPTRLVAATTAQLGRIATVAVDIWPIEPGETGVTRVAVAELPDQLAFQLDTMGYTEVFVIDVPAPDMETLYRLVALSSTTLGSAHGVVHRLLHSRQLTSLTLLRAHHDVLLEHAATHDALTNVPNRVGLAQRFKLLNSGPDGCTMLYLDLDGFKPINDTYGHAVGDQVLAAVADRLRCAVRSRDTLARVGGDEFAILIPGPGHDATRPARIADRVLQSLAVPIALDTPTGTLTVQLTISIGIARATTGATLEHLMIESDAAMYAAKRAGGNCFRGSHVMSTV